MHVLVTGITGTIGSAAARALVRRGHRVTGTLREGSRGGSVPEGVEVVVTDLFTPGALTDVARGVDGAVHAASSNDERADELDRVVVDTLVSAFDGRGKPLVYTSGLWLHGDVGPAPLTEDSPLAPPVVVAWRPAVEQLLIDAAERGVRTVRIRPGLVYGGGRGYVPLLLAPQQLDGRCVVRQLGDGSHRWAVVHADDLGDLYASAVESAPAGSVYLAAGEEAVRMRDAAKVVADRHGALVHDWDPTDAQRHWSVLVEALMLDQVASHARAETDLGWRPRHPGLLAELGADSA